MYGQWDDWVAWLCVFTFSICSGEKLVYAVDIVVRITYFDFDTKKV